MFSLDTELNTQKHALIELELELELELSKSKCTRAHIKMAFGGAFGQVPQSPFGQGLSQMPFGQQNQSAQTSTGFGQSNPQQAGLAMFGQPNVQAQQFGQQQSGNQVTAQFGQQQQQSASSGK